MLKLRTIYPYGLNDRLGDEYKKDGTHELVGDTFSSLPRKLNRIINVSNFSRIPLLAMNKFNLKNTAALFKII